MKLHEDDPRLTAYLTGDLDSAERAALEQEARDNPATRALLETWQADLDAIQSVLDAERSQAPSLDPGRRRAVLAALRQTEPKRSRRHSGWQWVMLSGAALTTAVILAVPAFIPAGESDDLEGVANVTPPLAAPGADERLLDVLPESAAVTMKEQARAGLPEIASGHPPLTRSGADAPMTGPQFSSERTERDSGVWRGPRPGLEQTQTWPDHESYSALTESGFRIIADAGSATSTFSADVDTASYANVRRFLQTGTLPPADAVRIEELINYFPYAYPEPKPGETFGIDVEVATAPWNRAHRLARIGLRARGLPEPRPAMNLVFLIDVSGSMRPANRLPLVRRSLRALTQNLDARDRVAIVTYAGASGLALPSTPVSDRPTILAALDRMEAGGSTNGGAGIELAYRVARENRIEGGVNRVILCTDGDFNVGVTDHAALLRLIRQRANEGIYLSIFGFGMGNLKDDRLEKLSNEGNGTYGYIDTFAEAQRVFGQQLEGTLATVAQDVKFQIEFNPARVAAYRLIGYENRLLNREDFNDDTKDAGDVGAGQTVTALYEIVPVGGESNVRPIDSPRYFTEKLRDWVRPVAGEKSGELFFLKIRYKQPGATTSQLVTRPVQDRAKAAEQAGPDFRFAAAVAGFGMLLRDSSHAGQLDWPTVIRLARDARGDDPHGHRSEFVRLAEMAQTLKQ